MYVDLASGSSPQLVGLEMSTDVMKTSINEVYFNMYVHYYIVDV